MTAAAQPRVQKGVTTGGQWRERLLDAPVDLAAGPVHAQTSDATTDDQSVTLVVTRDGRVWSRSPDESGFGKWTAQDGQPPNVATDDQMRDMRPVPVSDYPVGQWGTLPSGEASGTILWNADERRWGVSGIADNGATSESGHPSFAEAELALLRFDQESSPQRFGDVGNVREGSRTPWGKADAVTHVAPGIAVVSTPGHGGVKLSPERNKAIPTPLRRPSGWYEEDAESYIALAYHPEAGAQAGRISLDSMRAEMVAGVKDWFPDEFEQATGETIPFGVSRRKDEDAWRAAHADREIGVSAIFADGDRSMVEVTLARGGDRSGQTRVVRMPATEYDRRSSQPSYGAYRPSSYVLPQDADYPEVVRAPKPPPAPKPRYRGVNEDYTAMTPTAAGRVRRDLDKRWRDPDGSVSTLREMIVGGQVTGKTVYIENGRRMYALTSTDSPEGVGGGDSFSMSVSKATWDAVEAPDVRPPAQVAADDLALALARRDAIPLYEVDARRKAGVECDRLRAHRDRLRGLAAAAVPAPSGGKGLT